MNVLNNPIFMRENIPKNNIILQLDESGLESVRHGGVLLCGKSPGCFHWVIHILITACTPSAANQTQTEMKRSPQGGIILYVRGFVLNLGLLIKRYCLICYDDCVFSHGVPRGGPYSLFCHDCMRTKFGLSHLFVAFEPSLSSSSQLNSLLLL